MYDIKLNDEQVNSIIEAIKGLGGNLKWDLIFYGLIPIISIAVTTYISIKINKKQLQLQFELQNNELKSQLKIQQIALKKEVKVRALLDGKNAVLNSCRSIALLDISFNEMIRGIISTDELYNKMKEVEEEVRKNCIIINNTNCLVTDYQIKFDYILDLFKRITNSIYYNYCFPESEIPEMFRDTIIDKKDNKLIFSYFYECINNGPDIMEDIEKEISKTIESIV
ncbi:Uncharacterised protein [uncultured Clostridium sp.]|uniref:hypothetical protein n=1 Tax=uncultured Clostridium sp. TaxID=59620 RepID=UPI000821A411|nr:hypothetical protein [uncultured Clostridium sp.]SCI99684.1 Uncharacterised protein [uncultured Clostridium sp.]